MLYEADRHYQEPELDTEGVAQSMWASAPEPEQKSKPQQKPELQRKPEPQPKNIPVIVNPVVKRSTVRLRAQLVISSLSLTEIC